MANINFSPDTSTNKIFRGLDRTRCLSDDIDNLEQNKADKNHVHTQYAQISHTHNNYAPTKHTHTTAELADLETVLAEKADSKHVHNYAPTSHTHQQSSISGLTKALNNKANVDHTHAGTLKTKNADPISISGSSTFTGTVTAELEKGCTYLISIKYTGESGVVDQSLYSVYYDSDFEEIPTYNLVKCAVGEDNLVLRNEEKGITYNLSLNSSNSSVVKEANIKII